MWHYYCTSSTISNALSKHSAIIVFTVLDDITNIFYQTLLIYFINVKQNIFCQSWAALIKCTLSTMSSRMRSVYSAITVSFCKGISNVWVLHTLILLFPYICNYLCISSAISNKMSFMHSEITREKSLTVTVFLPLM